ncbi:Six-bladed beta-propeller, TolB-like protein [Beauveria brongniartii RCEF 3172]|uniref:Six-bladed beta-propeller, TolB-like protein n=1 Tax=Beauveria brongniartii RCEF 3172 TaxID=1081107 RepID=A0A166YWK9_9HYPO|nr:Six-bladed beta-propeller, TolB-like protein [Beauveria brongniartii RCEF 3172]
MSIVTLALTAQAAYTAQLLHQFPSHLQWVENMALRPNGNILMTTFDQAQIYELNPNNGSPPRLVAALPDADVAIGIAETLPDVFAVEAGHLNRTSYRLDGSGRIDTLDWSRLDCHGRPKVQTVAALPQAKLANGLAALPMHSHLVLSADSITGTIYRTDTSTGHVDVAIHDPKLAPHDNPDPFLTLIGVNGLQTHNGYLYVTSTSARFLGRYKIDSHGNPLSELEILATDGAVFGAVPLDSVSKAKAPTTTPRNGSDYYHDVVFLVDHDGELQRPTAAILSLDETTLYVSTGGRNEEGGKGGQIFAVRLT